MKLNLRIIYLYKSYTTFHVFSGEFEVEFALLHECALTLHCTTVFEEGTADFSTLGCAFRVTLASLPSASDTSYCIGN